ncbi:MAG: apolipoprotein N-acyltransferase, partial [Candidatus Omnitrophota bacterium]
MAGAFSTFNISLFVWVGLIPLFFAIEGKSPKQAFIISCLTGFLFFLFSMYWLMHVTPMGWVILSLYQALYFGLFGLFLSLPLNHPTLNSKLSTYLAIPSVWSLLEYLRSHIGGGIGWNLLGYAEYQNLPIIQIADITGVYGVSFLIVLVNFSVFSIIRMGIKCQKTHKRLFAKSALSFIEQVKINPFFQSFAVLFTVISVISYGYIRMNAMEERVLQQKEIKVSVVQGNIQQMHKWDPGYKDYIMRKYERLTFKAAKDSPQLIIWPETSIPGYLNVEGELKKYAQDMARASQSELLVGAPMIDITGERDINEYNSALLFSKQGEKIEQYNKMRLVLFGEYIPLERYLPFLRRYLPLTASFVPGNEYTLFSFQNTGLRIQPKFGVLICFEDIFPGMVRRFVKNGADLMVNITNDAWFKRTSAAYQHAANSVFRAVENRRPFVRSANTGLSCFINRAGRIYAGVSTGKIDLFVDGYKSAPVKILPGEAFSFYTRFGD